MTGIGGNAGVGAGGQKEKTGGALATTGLEGREGWALFSAPRLPLIARYEGTGAGTRLA
jgi:hypothetical protein